MIQRFTNKKFIGWSVTFTVLAIILLIPTSANFSIELRTFFAITLFMISIIAFELLPMMVSAILLPSTYLMSGIVGSDVAFSSWTSTTVWMVLGGLVLSNVLDECGLLKRIACFVIKQFGGTYAGAVFGCFTVGIILNLLTFTHGWIVNSALVYGVCQAMNLKRSRESALVCFAGISAATGTTICFYNPGYVSMLETSLAKFEPGYTMSPFLPFMYNGLFLVWCLLTIIILMKVYKTKDMNVDFNKDTFAIKYEELGEMSIQEKKSIVVVVMLLIYLFTTRVTGLPAAYGFMTIPYLLFIPGMEVGNTQSFSKMNFAMIFFVAACLGIGAVGAKIGFGDFLTNLAVPLLEGRSVLVASIAFMLFGMFANLFMTPYAMLGGLSVPFAQIAISLEINPVVGLMILLLTCDMVFLPYQSTGNLIMYSYGLMPMKDFIKQQALKTAIMFFGFIFVMYPLWGLLGLM